MILKTSHAILRPWTWEDRGSIVQYANNLQIARNLRDGFPHPYRIEDADRFITMAKENHPHIFLAIEVDGVAVGGIGIHLFDNIYRRTAEIGYWLAEPFWNRGIVTSSIRTIIPIAFRERDIIRLQAGVFSNNPASMKVLEKNGFILEAIHTSAITKGEKTFDEHLYVIFRESIYQAII